METCPFIDKGPDQNQFQNKGRKLGGILETKRNEVADRFKGGGGEKLMAYSCCAPLAMLALLHRIHARSASPARVKDTYYWFVLGVGGGRRDGSDPMYMYVCMYKYSTCNILAKSRKL